MAAATDNSLVLTGHGEPERVTVERVTPNYFQTLGVSPPRGRAFAPDKSAAKQQFEAVISYDLWQRKFAADPQILGKTFALSNSIYTVTGVMPEGFQYALGPCDVWTPAALGAQFARSDERENRALTVVARLKDGVPIERARAEIAASMQNLTKESDAEKGWIAEIVSLRDHRSNENERVFMAILMTITAIVLLIVCVNVAGIFLVRCADRQAEFAVRTALGASRWRTVRQLLAEALLLALLGGGAGLLVSVWGIQILPSHS